VRWFELRKTGANWTLFQEGTYAPGSISRWMGAIAMDRSGNIALGYNVGSSSVYPGLRYVGRLASNPYHVYWANRGNCNTFPFACLDVDDTTSFGPETITIKQRYAGTYVYAVYNYSNETAITSSGGRVQIYGPSGLVATYNVPTSGNGRWWYVFDLNGSTGQITPRNVIQTNSPGPYSAAIEEIGK
jgi:hypothetical protein